MTTNKTEIEPDFAPRFEQVKSKEKDWIKKRREFLGQNPHAPMVGLALSGGGIRSATFNLGVLQALSRKKLLPEVDILSTVSGGGYIGACFNWIRNQVSPERYRDFTETPIDKSSGNGKAETVLDWLRGHGNYLIAGKGFSVWQLIASIIAGTLLNLIVLIPLFLWVITLMSADWSAAFDWPQFLHFSETVPIQRHDGFLLALLLGKFCLVLYLIMILAFGLTGVFPAFERLTQRYFFRRNMGRLLGLGIGLIVVGFLPLLAGIENWVRANFEQESAAQASRHLAYLVPLVTGVFTLFQSKQSNKSKSSSGLLAAVGLSLLMYGFFVLLYHLVNHTQLVESTTFLVWSAISVILAFTSDVNAISMHSYYRGRLALAYMPVVKNESGEKVGIDNAMDFELSAMSPKYGGPLPIINTTINTTSSKRQKLRSREGDSFFLTPLYCGSSFTGFASSEEFKNGELALSTAFSVSGAAVDPNTYVTSSRPIAFLMTLLNFRLGYWTDNPNPKFAPKRGRAASWYRLMLREMFGKGLSETGPQIHLSDGGHFENLGIYELLRRQCRYIVVGDASADLDMTMSDLGKAIQRARADFGVEIEIDISTLDKQEQSMGCACRLGKIRYSDGSLGELLYIKSQIQDKLSADVYAYWRKNSTFPDQSTADQFFDEWQFDSYRELGYQITSKIIASNTSFETLFESLDNGR